MNKCANPNCNKELQAGATNRKEYCSGRCQQYHNLLRRGLIDEIDDLEKDQARTITLHNGLEIRNDAMGKEVAGYLNHSYVGREII